MKSWRATPDPSALNHALDRREFLKKSLAGAVLLGSAGLLARCTSGGTERPAGLALLEARQFKTLAAFCQAVLPGPETSAPVLATPYRIDLEVSQWSIKNQSLFKSLLALIEDGTRFFFFSWRSFSQLSVSERRAYLLGWERSLLDFRRTAYQALRMMAFFYYYSQEATWAGIGYDGPWIKPGASPRP